MNLSITPNFNQLQVSKNSQMNNLKQDNIAFGNRYCMSMPKYTGIALTSKTGERTRTSLAEFVLVQIAQIFSKRPEIGLIKNIEILDSTKKLIKAKNMVMVLDTSGKTDNLYFLTKGDTKNISSSITEPINSADVLNAHDSKEIFKFFQDKIFPNIID